MKPFPLQSCPSVIAAAECPPVRCRISCALEALDELLTSQAVTGEEADLLLDLRVLMAARTDAEGALRHFCEARRRMEARHYLVFYRLRRWLENQVIVLVRQGTDAAPVFVPLRLNFYCIEAVRRFCLCAAARQQTFDAPARLSFAFLPGVKTTHAAAIRVAPMALSGRP